jgi:hypothetical protein
MDDPREEGSLCQACGKRYKVDVWIPKRFWRKITPRRDNLEAGLLCGPCALERIEQLFGFAAFRLVERR